MKGKVASPRGAPTEEGSMIKGSCLCGGAHFEPDRIPLIVNCHCSMCRNYHGTAFGAFPSVPLEEVRFLEGEDRIERDESSPGNSGSSVASVGHVYRSCTRTRAP